MALLLIEPCGCYVYMLNANLPFALERRVDTWSMFVFAGKCELGPNGKNVPLTPGNFDACSTNVLLWSQHSGARHVHHHDSNPR